MDKDVEAALLGSLVGQIQNVNRLVAEAQGLKGPDRRDKFAEAGRTECRALKDVLQPYGLLQLLREQLEDPQLRPIALPLTRPRVIELGRLLREPVLTQVLEELGYEPPPPPRTLTDQISRSLIQVTVAARHGTHLPTFDRAEAALEQFRAAVCDLTGITEDAQQRSEWINRGRATLVTLLLAAVITPGLAEAAQHVTPHALELLQAVAERAGGILHTLSLSTVAVASRIAYDAVADSSLRAETDLTRSAAALDERRIRFAEDIDSARAPEQPPDTIRPDSVRAATDAALNERDPFAPDQPRRSEELLRRAREAAERRADDPTDGWWPSAT